MILSDIEDSIAHGRRNAILIEWAEDEPSLFAINDRDPVASIEAAKRELAAGGWKWNPVLNQMEKDGWLCWFRSQGKLAPPIAQWSRIESKLTPEL